MRYFCYFSLFCVVEYDQSDDCIDIHKFHNQLYLSQSKWIQHCIGQAKPQKVNISEWTNISKIFVIRLKNTKINDSQFK